jgi:RNA polymerase sigma factor (sigma-70 family)
MAGIADRRSDAELLRASARDPEAFGEFYDRHAACLLAFFQRRIRCPELAADLTGETFAQAFGARGRYRDTGAPALAWLLGIARLVLAASLRRRGVEDRGRRQLGLAPLRLDDLSLERIEQLADAADVWVRVQSALEQLPPDTVRAIELRAIDELPYAQVARRLGCSEGAARVRVRRGLKRLADTVEPVDPPEVNNAQEA